LTSKGGFIAPAASLVVIEAPGSGGYGPPSQREAARLREDLDLDSLDAVVLASHLEQASGLVVEEDHLKKIRTVKDIVDVVEELLERERAHVARS